MVVVQCDQGLSLERQLAADLPLDALGEVVMLAVDLNDTSDPESSVSDAISSQLPDDARLETLDSSEWPGLDMSLDDVRVAIGRASTKGRWFKQEGAGRRLGEIVVSHLDQITETKLGIMIRELADFGLDRAEHIEDVGDDGGTIE